MNTAWQMLSLVVKLLGNTPSVKRFSSSIMFHLASQKSTVLLLFFLSPPPFSEWLQLFLVLSYTLLMSYVKEVIGYWTGTLITTTLITLKRLSFVWVCSVYTIWHFNEDGGGGRNEGGERSIGTDSSCERCSLKFRSFQSSLAYKKREKKFPIATNNPPPPPHPT